MPAQDQFDISWNEREILRLVAETDAPDQFGLLRIDHEIPIPMGEEERKLYLQGLCGRLTLEVTEGVLRIKVA